MFDEKVLDAFLKNQSQLFDEPVADTREEADAFLEDCMAQVVKGEKQVIDYFEEVGVDMTDLPDGIMGASEVFAVGDGRFLIVEG